MAHFRCKLCKETSTLSIFALVHECPALPGASPGTLEFMPREQVFHWGISYEPAPPPDPKE